MTSASLHASVRALPAGAVIDLVGDINGFAEHELERAWTEAASGSPLAVVLNLAQVGYINSTGIALIVGLLTRARAEGRELRAFGLSDHYREIFDITRLSDYLALHPDEASALTLGSDMGRSRRQE